MLRRRAGELHGTYSLVDGTVRGKVDADGVFRGSWCEHPTRRPGRTDDASDVGLVEWRLLETCENGPIVSGTWSYGYQRRRDGSFEPDGLWELEKLEIDRRSTSRAASTPSRRGRTVTHRPWLFTANATLNSRFMRILLTGPHAPARRADMALTGIQTDAIECDCMRLDATSAS